MHLEQPVHVLHGRAAALGHPDLALGIEQVGARPLLGRHRCDDRIHAQQDLLVDRARRHRRLRLFHAGDHARQRAKPAHAPHLQQLGAQIVHVELALGHFRGKLFGFLDLDGLGRALDQADDIAHAQNAPGDALRVERLQPVHLLAGADELDRPFGHRAHRQGGPAARIAVHAGQDHAGQRHLRGEGLGDIDRILTGQRIDDQQHFLRRGHIGHRAHLVHQRLIDMQPPGSVEQQHVKALQLRRIERAAGDVDRLLPLDDRQRRHAGLLAQRRQLLLRGGAIDVERRHQHLFAVALGQAAGELGGGRRLARALQADHHDHRRRIDGDVQLARIGAEHLDQRVMHDLDDLLPRRDRAQHLRADRRFGHLVDKAADDRQGDIGLEQGDPHFAHRGADIRLAERAAATQPVKDPAQPFAQSLEHRLLLCRLAKQRTKRRWAKPRRPAPRIAVMRIIVRPNGNSASLRAPPGKINRLHLRSPGWMPGK